MSFIIQPGVSAEDLAGGALTTTSATSITLNPTSERVQNIAMTASGRSVTLPDATNASLAEGGPLFVFKNAGSNPFSILDNAAGFIANLGPGQVMNVYLMDNSTAAGTWRIDGPQTTVQAVASGSLSNGNVVVLNNNGSVGSIQANVGSRTTFDSDQADKISSVYDPIAQKIIIVYADGGNSNYGTAIVGTVSGTSISFGTPVVFLSANFQVSNAITYDVNAQKVVVVFRDASNSTYGTAIVGTVSGTSISFGTKVLFKSQNVDFLSCAYDANALKVYIAYRTVTPDNGQAIIGTVSGTSMTFGTPVNFAAGSGIGYTRSIYDAGNQKIVTGYDTSFIVATISGTSVSFGAVATVTGQTQQYSNMAYDANAGKIVYAFRDTLNSNYGSAIVGTVSGTSISFGTRVVFQSSAVQNTFPVYDSNLQKVPITYGSTTDLKGIIGTVSGTSISFNTAIVLDSGDSTNGFWNNYDANAKAVVTSLATQPGAIGQSIVWNTSYAILSASNFIGFSNGDYSNGQTAVINTIGNVQTGLSGLTTASLYYVQTNGTLSTSPGSPSVYAGVALSATSLLIKG